MGRIIGLVVGVALLGMLFAGSFLGAFHAPEPHGVPVAVVAPAEQVRQLQNGVDRRRAGAFALSGYATAGEARAALLDRQVDAVLVPQEGTLVVASAGGRTGATVITAAFQGAAQAQGRTLRVEDAVPLPPGDAGGIAGMFYVLSVVLPGIALPVLLTRAAPGLGAAGRIGVLAAGSLVAGTANAWLADVVFGALPGSFGPLVAVSAGISLAVGLVVAGLVKVIGTPGVGVAALLFIPIGLPAGGGPLGARYIPEWYAAVGRILPVGPAAEAVRNTVFFGGAALWTPLGVLALWALLGLVLLALPGRRTQAAPAVPRTPVAA
ncbi:hypothetical protein DMB42_38165 [Nonomuraea sp. WAC 01424]|uniref:hypothetical protein n=1 Tax=Nonomuraea sp. WAC 01424 TaxID=2203200 RepID=UPI000F77D6C3|nr:hypothetical protein [Nonomuraea sp. WAC 01424]RSN01979.1 hypothetical protein DMB42_38165 [Nonomuraea sp. WAC 01424]